MQLIFATNNQHKVDEIRISMPDLSVLTLKEAGINIDIPEPYNTLEENAAEKARTIYKITKTSCFSEDTGMEVYSLNNEPGVHSARYAGDERSFQKNIEKVLNKLKHQKDRKAQFRAVLCLIIAGKEFYFEGICKGEITHEPKGDGGFGYDSIFVPEGYEKTFAEMLPQEKAGLSHRKKAIEKLVTFLNKY
ncbi:MAG TPA: RdgB/HAM1 family non-canonical purine NTP pyrophosphatase [Flavisolibacter sp.]|jgi:XTP/dITP diphosphohydrolase|nr:RdgB/HAM1 family non-canonical purine NTP pyrophosphatase [Flavisolibacter sp.]